MNSRFRENILTYDCLWQVDVKSRREVHNEELVDLRIEMEQLRQANKLDTYGFVINLVYCFTPMSCFLNGYTSEKV